MAHCTWQSPLCSCGSFSLPHSIPLPACTVIDLVLQSLQFLTLKLCCHPQISVCDRVNRTFKEQEAKEGVKHSKPQPLSQVLSWLRGSLEVAWGADRATWMLAGSLASEPSVWEGVPVPVPKGRKRRKDSSPLW